MALDHALTLELAGNRPPDEILRGRKKRSALEDATRKQRKTKTTVVKATATAQEGKQIIYEHRQDLRLKTLFEVKDTQLLHKPGSCSHFAHVVSAQMSPCRVKP